MRATKPPPKHRFRKRVTTNRDPKSSGAFPYRMTFNDTSDIRMAMSQRTTRSNIDVRRDFDKECGWPRRINLQNYVDMWERGDYPSRVVSIYPDECWAVNPDIYETDRVRNTPFEKAWNALTEFDEDGNPTNLEANPLHYCHRVDVISGIGRYGGLLLGIDDGKALDKPVDGIDKYGEIIQGDFPKRKLLFIRALDESLFRIATFDVDTASPRFGKPKTYQLRIAALGKDSERRGGDSFDPFTEDSITVHWSRIVHVADNRATSEVFGIPRMRPVFNRLLDILKILGGAAEMFYQGGFPGLALTLDPTLLAAGLPDVDADSIDDQMYLYMNRLQRYLHLVGYEAKSLAPNIADPTGNIMVQLQAIATALGVPLRIFLGAEQAQLASGQDVRTWNRRLSRRHNRYLTPMLVRPLVDRLVAMRVLPMPKMGPKSYKVVWPDVNMPNADELSVIADRNAASMMKFMQSGAWQIMHPATFFRVIMGMNADQVDVIMEDMKKLPKLDVKTLQALTAIQSPTPPAAGLGKKPGKKGNGGGDSGSRGRSPSKPPAGGKTS